MTVNFDLDSVKKENGKWIPAISVYLHSSQTDEFRYEWPNQEFDDKEKANFMAKVQATRYLIKIGILNNKTN